MAMVDEIPAVLLAPCGMNCLLCYAHLRKKKPCPGCRGTDAGKPEHCRRCKIKDCAAGQGVEYCFQCESFPCAPIKRMDQSYRRRYQVSLIERALRLESVGAERFLREERCMWTCAKCGGVISLHDRACSECGEAL